MNESAAPAVLREFEEHHIDVIPDNERHGKVWHQFTLWAGGNTNVFNLVLGGVLIYIGLSFYWSVVAIVVGTAIGAILIALHATQGPKLGVPQMIQSRGQFGFYGSSFLFLAVFLLNFGFIAAQFVIQAQAMNLVADLSIPVWILILTVPAVIIGLYGYRWIHRVAQFTAVLVGISIVVLFIQASVKYGSPPAKEMSWHAPTVGLFGAGVALLVIDMLSFGPFVSDYSRYLPKNVSAYRVFWSIYLGNLTATTLACVVGAYITALMPNLGTVAAVSKISGPWLLIIMAFSLINADTFNAYTGSFQILSLANMFKVFKPSRMIRIWPFLFTMAVGVVVAILGYKSFVNNLANFLDFLLVIFIPWSAVNLVDYFIVRHEEYDVPSFFRANGIYGKWAWRGLVAYFVALLAEVPFISQVDYTGILVKHLGGADISWIVGFVVAAVLYIVLAKIWPLNDPKLVPAVGVPQVVTGESIAT